MAHGPVATIAAEAPCLTLVNSYEVEPEKQGDLVRLLSEITDGTMRHEPGFVSVAIHSSLDGTRVVNYAQWTSREHFDAFMKKPGTMDQLKRFAALAKSVSPALYKVNSVMQSSTACLDSSRSKRRESRKPRRCTSRGG